jgi:hypothetical protein
LPDIQRKYVWELIESLHLNIPIPVLYFAETILDDDQPQGPSFKITISFTKIGARDDEISFCNNVVTVQSNDLKRSAVPAA